ncbi:15053_t:CDS:1, partial [Gigaspora rosea]
MVFENSDSNYGDDVSTVEGEMIMIDWNLKFTECGSSDDRINTNKNRDSLSTVMLDR